MFKDCQKTVILDAVIIKDDPQERSNGSALMSSEGERMAKKKCLLKIATEVGLLLGAAFAALKDFE